MRYVDDFVVLGDDRDWLWHVRDEIAAYLANRLRLTIHPRKCVVPVTTGPDFLGYRVFPTHRLLRRWSGVKFGRTLRRLSVSYARGEIETAEIKQRIASWLGHAGHADTYGLRTSLLGSVAFRRAQAD